MERDDIDEPGIGEEEVNLPIYLFLFKFFLPKSVNLLSNVIMLGDKGVTI